MRKASVDTRLEMRAMLLGAVWLVTWPRAYASAQTLPALPAISDAGVSAVTSDAGALSQAGVDAGFASVTGCVDVVPSGGTKPRLTETFPERGLSGYVATLVVRVEHGKGERVLPRGFEFQADSDAARALKGAGFIVPDQDGGVHAQLRTETRGEDHAVTAIELPLLVLPSEPGRHVLTLPPLPIAVARASGEMASICTLPHKIVVDDPIASTPSAQPKGNPPAKVQREEWTALRNALQFLGIGLLAGGLIAIVVYFWLRRPKPVPPPPPPRPPWEVALEKLDEVRHAGLLEVGRYSDYFDRVNDAIRSYLGARYGFDGLEMTTDEIVLALNRASTPGLNLPEVIEFLQESDLVKFANMTPTAEACDRVIAIGERIVRATMPPPKPTSTRPAQQVAL